MKRQIKRIIIIVLALTFLAFGVIGLFLPILQGVLFIIVGLILLSFSHSSVDEKLLKYINKYPKLAGRYSKLRQKLRKYFE